MVKRANGRNVAKRERNYPLIVYTYYMQVTKKNVARCFVSVQRPEKTSLFRFFFFHHKFDTRKGFWLKARFIIKQTTRSVFVDLQQLKTRETNNLRPSTLTECCL